MSSKSARTIASMIAGVLLIAGYAVYALGKSGGSLQSWAVTMLIFIGISVAAEIAVQILFHIALSVGIAVREGIREEGRGKDEESGKQYEKEVERIITSAMREDERDQLISLKTARIGTVCAGAGCMAALIALAAGAWDVLALHVAFGGFFAGALAEGAARIFCYERGVRNG